MEVGLGHPPSPPSLKCATLRKIFKNRKIKKKVWILEKICIRCETNFCDNRYFVYYYYYYYWFPLWLCYTMLYNPFLEALDCELVGGRWNWLPHPCENLLLPLIFSLNVVGLSLATSSTFIKVCDLGIKSSKCINSWWEKKKANNESKRKFGFLKKLVQDVRFFLNLRIRIFLLFSSCFFHFDHAIDFA